MWEAKSKTPGGQEGEGGYVCWGQGAGPGLGRGPGCVGQRPSSGGDGSREGALEKAALGGEPGPRPNESIEGAPSLTPAQPAARPRPASPALCPLRLRLRRRRQRLGAAHPRGPGRGGAGAGAAQCGAGRPAPSGGGGGGLPTRTIPARPGPARILLGRRRRQRQRGELPTMHRAASISTSPDITAPPPGLLHHRPFSDITFYSALPSTLAALGFSLSDGPVPVLRISSLVSAIHLISIPKPSGATPLLT